MADARRSQPPSPPRRADRSAAGSRAGPLVDEDGFRTVVSRRRICAELRRSRRPPPRRPVPADLVGRCFNCLAFDHIASQCTQPSRCLHCEAVGHSAKNCKRPRVVNQPWRGRGRPVRRAGAGADAGAAAHSRGVGPWPRRTVFRQPGYGWPGDAPGGCAGDSGAGASDDHQLVLPLRFGRWPSSRSQRPRPQEDLEPWVPDQRISLPARGSDPMIHEAILPHAPRGRVSIASDNWVPRHSPSRADTFDDPMILEASLMTSCSATPGPAAAPVVDAVSQEDQGYSPADMVAEQVGPAPGSSPDMVASETVRFVDAGSDPVLSSSSASRRNITVTRGARGTLPLHLFSEADALVQRMVADFAETVCTEAPPPVLDSSPPRRRSRSQPPPTAIRRSERLAKKSRHRATKPAVQAQNVMMKRLGLTSEEHPPDASSFQQFTATFSSSLTDAQCDALDELLPAGLGSFAVAVDPVAS